MPSGIFLNTPSIASQIIIFIHICPVIYFKQGEYFDTFDTFFCQILGHVHSRRLGDEGASPCAHCIGSHYVHLIISPYMLDTLSSGSGLFILTTLSSKTMIVSALMFWRLAMGNWIVNG